MDWEKALRTRAGKSDYSQQSRLPEIHGFLGASDSYRLPEHLSSLALRTRSIGLTWSCLQALRKMSEDRQPFTLPKDVTVLSSGSINTCLGSRHLLFDPEAQTFTK